MLANFESVFLGCIDADVSKEIENIRLKNLAEIYKVHSVLQLSNLKRFVKRVELQKGTESAKGTGEVDGALEGSSVVEWRCS